ncbi:hypothetical protein T440DRAFT_489502 [Plenodomus tracheiphilus IPT5]|uniref:Uncharacterized protein n=1 Tax=Plenodomus tracheiphilus IPT5 TaxID=1408161 RepID=A0A6A7B5X2_9PLEO|nr:hypothetical protein T440DRAFT_489502 [Plenodomus tracheiphilus IPT5]
MAPSVDSTALPPPARVPKLRFRNPLPSDQASLSSQQSHGTGSPSASLQSRSSTPDSNPAASSISRPSLDAASLSPPSLASTTSSAASSNESRSSKKRNKAGSVLSFLSLKEPSHSALEHYAEQQRKQAAGKASSTTLSQSTNNYANQKLPANVPKVNSKWNGVPSLKKNHCSTASASSKDNRSSVASRGSLGAHVKGISWNDSRLTVMTDGARNPPNSMVSPVASMSNMTNGSDSALTSSPLSTTLPEITYYFPDALDMSDAMPSATTITEDRPSSELAARLSDSTWETRSSMDESLDFRADSPASSTDSVDTVVRDTADNIFRRLNDQPHHNLWGDDAHAAQTPDEDYVPESHNFLFSEQRVVQTETKDSAMVESPVLSAPLVSAAIPHYAPSRPIQNFSRPTSSSGFRPPNFRSLSMSSYRRAPSASALPTLYEVSLASSTESLGTVRDNRDRDGDTYSIAPSTIAPSELSKHWYESPRERLGLGGRLKMNDVSPWDSQGETRASRVFRRRSAEV